LHVAAERQDGAGGQDAFRGAADASSDIDPTIGYQRSQPRHHVAIGDLDHGGAGGPNVGDELLVPRSGEHGDP
jgi:hypothetical protein